MALETGTWIEDLDETNPVHATDQVDEGDDHIRLTKKVLKNQFTSLGNVAVTKTAAEINDLVEQTDPILNGSVSGTAFLDEDDMASDSSTSISSQQAIKAHVETSIDTKVAGLNTKIIDIGDWNMDTTASVNVAHGLTLSKIRTVQIMIRNDAATLSQGIEGPATSVDGNWQATATNIVPVRTAGGYFDSVNFDSTSYNRGWITIQYTD